MVSEPYSESSRPRLGTRRSNRPTLGNAVSALAERLGRPPLDWQRHVLEVGLEVGPGGTWAFPEVGVAVARQNGKTGGLLHLRILAGLLLWSESILHSAQNRDLPRESFLEIAALLQSQFPGRLAAPPRRANGQESVRLRNGAVYRILAPRPEAPRGHHADLVVIDEVREYRDTAFVSAILPTLNTSKNPQVWWTSNAGDPDSVVLNSLRSRGLEGDPSIAWLEWSADPGLSPDDEEGWRQANPSLGTLIDLDRIRHLHSVMTPSEFETEVLCRWVQVSGSRAIPAALWDAARDPDLKPPRGMIRPVLAVDIDPDRKAAGIVAAWRLDDGRVGTDLVGYRTGNLDGLLDLVSDLATELEPTVIGFDPWTTEVLAADLEARGRLVNPVTGRSWVSACQNLVDLLQTGRLVHPGRETLSVQLAHSGRKETTEGRWWITRGSEPIPAVTATVRAVALASRPAPIYAVH